MLAKVRQFGHTFLPAAVAAITLVTTGGAAGSILQRDELAEPRSSPAAVDAILDTREFRSSDENAMRQSPLGQAVARGRWTTACNMAADTLAGEQPDIDALGIFSICAAIRNDRAVVVPSLGRLGPIEPAPYRYTQLVEGILHLMDKAPDKALAAFEELLSADSGNPLASYFSGEALHALGRDAEAIRAFRSSLDRWPEHAPALAAIARLTAGADASPEALESAIEMMEKATHIEPVNRGYWRQLADLCERNGEVGRASAIRLQWLTPRFPK